MDEAQIESGGAHTRKAGASGNAEANGTSPGVSDRPPSLPDAYRSNSRLFVRIYNLYAPSPGDRDDNGEKR